VPTVLDPQGPLVEIFRSELPVAPSTDGTWHLVVPHHGIVGEGRRVVRFGPAGDVRWSVDLPERYALVSSDDGGHLAYVAHGGRTLLVLAGVPGGREPAAVMALDAESSHQLWEVELPALGPRGSLRLASGSAAGPDRGVPVVARCDGGACGLRALDEIDGRVLWSRQVPGATLVAGGFNPVVGGRGLWAGPTEQPWIWAVGPRFLQAVSKVDGTLGGRTPITADDVGIVLTRGYRVVVVTAPQAITCRATATGYAVQADGGAAQIWSVPFRWDDPRAARGSHGCRYDPAQPLRWADLLVLPDADGALVIDDRDGAIQHRRSRGEYQLAGYGLVWNGSRYLDRGFSNGHVINVPPPQSCGPWAVELFATAWVLGSGDGATLLTLNEPKPLWHQVGALCALALDIDRLAFLTADELNRDRSEADRHADSYTMDGTALGTAAVMAHAGTRSLRCAR
jgi:hypothetical protein